MPRRKSTVSTAAIKRDYIETHPSIKDGMRMGTPTGWHTSRQCALRAPLRAALMRVASGAIDIVTDRSCSPVRVGGAC